MWVSVFSKSFHSLLVLHFFLLIKNLLLCRVFGLSCWMSWTEMEPLFLFFGRLSTRMSHGLGLAFDMLQITRSKSTSFLFWDSAFDVEAAQVEAEDIKFLRQQKNSSTYTSFLAPFLWCLPGFHFFFTCTGSAAGRASAEQRDLFNFG